MYQMMTATSERQGHTFGGLGGHKLGWRTFQHFPQPASRPPLIPNNKHRHLFLYLPPPPHRHHHPASSTVENMPLWPCVCRQPVTSQIIPNVIVNRPSRLVFTVRRPHTHIHTETRANMHERTAPESTNCARGRNKRQSQPLSSRCAAASDASRSP